MIGTRIKKEFIYNEDDGSQSVSYDIVQYRTAAEWCNENNAVIEDKGEYYEVVEVPQPTLEELKTEKSNEAYNLFVQKRDAIRYVELSNGKTYGFDTTSEDITNFFASWKAAELDGQTAYKVWYEDGSKNMLMMKLEDFTVVFNAVRDSQYEAYYWFGAIVEQINACQTKEELDAIVLEG